MPDVVITEFMDEAAVLWLAEEFDVQYDPALVDDRHALLDSVSDARGLIVRNRTVVDAELLEVATSLEVIGRLGVGLDNIDCELCEHRGITVAPATGANADSVAEYVVAAILLLTRRAFSSSDLVARGAWPRTDLVGHEIAGHTAGLVGFGEIARKAAARLSALGMKVIAHDPFLSTDDDAWNDVRSVDMATLVGESDAISIHIPLTDATEGLFGAELIGSMRPASVLVNTSRGGIVDERALVAALREGRLMGAAMDVFTVEPVDTSFGSRFLDVPNLILTPHIAGVTVESNVRVSQMTVRNVRNILAGRDR
ncbi:MAG: hydroxyacid dehydrogenase [Actinomycetia bacterium]|nr:hydroxyacid dehydrogenase [Actinomycetes bacterium]